MDLDINGKTALVCGGSSGIGLAVARALRREGCDVIIAARNKTRLEAAARALGGARILVQDLTKRDAARQLAADAGPVDILLTNPGVSPAGDILDPATVAGACEGITAGTMGLIAAFLPAMRAKGWGRIVNITSSGVFAAGPALGLSGAVRAALTHLTASLSRQVAPDGVTVNCVAPGSVDTDGFSEFIQRRADETGADIDQLRAERLASLPTGRFVEAQEIGALCAFLASPLAASITGRTILADGGANPFPFL